MSISMAPKYVAAFAFLYLFLQTCFLNCVHLSGYDVYMDYRMHGIQFCGGYLPTSLFTLVKCDCNLAAIQMASTVTTVAESNQYTFFRDSNFAVSVFNIPLDVTHLLRCGDVHMNPGPSSDQHSDDLQHTGILHNDL